MEQNRTEQNIYFIDLNSTVSRHTYFDITKDSYKVTINVDMDLTTKLYMFTIYSKKMSVLQIIAQKLHFCENKS